MEETHVSDNHGVDDECTNPRLDVEAEALDQHVAVWRHNGHVLKMDLIALKGLSTTAEDCKKVVSSAKMTFRRIPGRTL